MVRKVLSSDLAWVFRERLISRNIESKNTPVAIIPRPRGWEVITPARYRSSTRDLFAEIGKELRRLYKLTREFQRCAMRIGIFQVLIFSNEASAAHIDAMISAADATAA